jgi:hypothetical protein
MVSKGSRVSNAEPNKALREAKSPSSESWFWTRMHEFLAAGFKAAYSLLLPLIYQKPKTLSSPKDIFLISWTL